MKKKFYQLKLEIDSLTVFADVKNDVVICRLRELLDVLCSKDQTDAVSYYSSFVTALYPSTVSLTDYIRTLILQDDNFYVKKKAASKLIDPEITEAVEHELAVLQNIAALTSDEVRNFIDYDGYLPSWTTHPIDLQYDFMEKINNVSKLGYGIFAKYNFFRLDEGEIIPVAHPDYQKLDQLFEYKRERDMIMKNTEALVDGTGASNMLLYGDAGTGKSSTIKAVAAALAPRGLRIIEVKKNQLYQIPKVMEELASNPLKFILFIDDLSFTGNDDNFSALKATLEGSISGCGDNAVIYATSNRRHLVKESFGDRAGDELHLNDTMQETMSLAARFGLTITFQKPGKDTYLTIVRSLAEEYGIEMDEEELFKKAEAHAIRKNGRSPRTAKQFIELLKIGI
ncbi:MAG: ATP-binding protein [Firmicutes bacterium]|nr:ATP-binding protein [Bacillota bacterium]